MRYILTLLGGVILGALLILFFFVGTPGARSLPGAPVQPPEGAPPPGTALVTLDERFFDTLLGTIFQQVGAPSFPLQFIGGERIAPEEEEGAAARSPFVLAQGGGCPNQVALVPEGSGVRTSVRFAEGRIQVPLAFNGSYNTPLGCANFRGWAQANVQIIFNQEQQIVYGQINVEGVNLEGAPALLSGVITQLVQQAINRQLNPLEILRAPQLAVPVPIQTGNGTLHARVREVRAEIVDNLLRLHITYDFSGAPSGQTTPTPQS